MLERRNEEIIEVLWTFELAMKTLIQLPEVKSKISSRACLDNLQSNLIFDTISSRSILEQIRTSPHVSSISGRKFREFISGTFENTTAYHFDVEKRWQESLNLHYLLKEHILGAAVIITSMITHRSLLSLTVRCDSVSSYHGIDRQTNAAEILSLSRSFNRHESPNARSPKIARSRGCKTVSSHELVAAAGYPHPWLFLDMFRHASESTRLSDLERIILH